MIAFLLLTVLVIGLLLFLARLIPESAAKDQLDRNVVILVLVSVIAGMGLGSFPPFAAIQRFWFWDNIVPTISEVSASSKEGPKASLVGNTLTVNESAPFGYTLQVKYMDGAGNPHFELVKDHTFVIPPSATDVQVRWVSGNSVTKWVSLDSSKATPATDPAKDPATGPTTDPEKDPADPVPGV